VIQTDAKPRIEIKSKTKINLYTKPQASVQEKERVMDRFYRSELKKNLPPLICKWEEITGLHPKEIKIKKMKTKWGTCNPKKERVWLNLELAKKPARCLEYMLVHELMHLKERHHNENFQLLLRTYLPQWEQSKQELNTGTLSYAEWTI
jgi:predicted metal-dependent hydrolase